MTLDQLAIKHGTDKSSKHHNYTPLYEQYFGADRHKRLNILELGYGGHEDVSKGGESAKMWREYFPNAIISVVDIEGKNNIPEGINFYRGSQSDKSFLTGIFEKHGAFDIIIDDASHVSSLTISSFEILFPLLKKGGIYVIEDTHSSYHDWYYGKDEANGNPERNGRAGITAMNYFKRLADEVNKDFLHKTYHKGFDIEFLSFYRDIIFIEKCAYVTTKTVTVLEDRVVKEYPKKDRELFEKELFAYQNIQFACPKLLDVKDCTLVIEKCTPILDIPDNKKYRNELYELLTKLNEQGYWHRDIALRNVVVNSEGKVLLIDWESMEKAVSEVSYDLHGLTASGYEGESRKGKDGMWWGYKGQPDSPGLYWNEL